jgi:hypothetical protein
MVALPSKIKFRWKCHHLISNLKNTRNDDPDPFATIEVCGAWYYRPSSSQLVAGGGVMGVSKMEGDDDNSTINLRG